MDLAPQRVTREEFVSLYVPGQIICPEGIRTSLAQDRRKGRLVMVHELATSPAEKRRALNLLPRLGAAHRALVLRVLEVDDEPVVVTKFLLGFVSFREWLEHAVAESSTVIVDTRSDVPDLDLASHSGTPASLALKTTEFEQVPLNLESVPSLEDTAVGGLASLEGGSPAPERTPDIERPRASDAPDPPPTAEFPFVSTGPRREVRDAELESPSAGSVAEREEPVSSGDTLSDVDSSFSDVFGKVSPTGGSDGKPTSEPGPPVPQTRPSDSFTDLFGDGVPEGPPVASGGAELATPELPRVPVVPPLRTPDRPVGPSPTSLRPTSGTDVATRPSAPPDGARAPDTEPGMTAIFGPTAESPPGASAKGIATPQPPSPVQTRASAAEPFGRLPLKSEPPGVAPALPRPPVVPTDLHGLASGRPIPPSPVEPRAPVLPSFGSSIPEAPIRQHVAPVPSPSVGLSAPLSVTPPRAPQFNEAAAIVSLPPSPAVPSSLGSSRVAAEGVAREASSVFTEMLQPVRPPSRPPGLPPVPSVGSLPAAPQRPSATVAPPIQAAVSVAKSRMPWPLVVVLSVSALLVIAVLIFAARQ